MNVKLVNRGDEGELLLDGRLDTSTASDAEKLFLDVAGRFTNITLNMKDLKYISSAGLRVIKKLYMKVKANGGVVSVTNTSSNVYEVFEMTGFAGILNMR